MSNEKRLDERHRLLEIREHLRVRAQIDDDSFELEVVATCAKKIQPIVNAYSDRPGEEIIGAIALDLGVHFEEVQSQADIDSLEQKYLVEQRELGFGRLAVELADPTVDALMFQRLKAAGEASDRWIAVINSQGSRARGYWSRAHELIHRVAEPPQRRLPFFRHREDHSNRIERIVDLGASEIAYPRAVFEDIVKSVSRRELTWDLVEGVRRRFAPSSSLQATAKAIVRYWPQPAFFVIAESRGRLRNPAVDIALRLDVEGFNVGAERSGIVFFKNMRVPLTSAISMAYDTVETVSEYENLGGWEASGRRPFPSRRALASGTKRGKHVYGLISLD